VPSNVPSNEGIKNREMSENIIMNCDFLVVDLKAVSRMTVTGKYQILPSKCRDPYLPNMSLLSSYNRVPTHC